MLSNGGRPNGDWLRPLSVVLALAAVAIGGATATALDSRANFGPYNVEFLSGGVGLTQPLATEARVIAARAPWSLSGWLRADRSEGGPLRVIAVGRPDAPNCRCLIVDDGHLALRLGPAAELRARVPLPAGYWHHVVASYDGDSARLYVDGTEVDSLAVATSPAAPELHLAPESVDDPAGAHHFGGALALFSLDDRALDSATIRALALARPEFALVPFNHVGVGWPWQERAWRGLLEPQAAWTLPHGKAPISLPRSAPPSAEPALAEGRSGVWAVGAWRLAAAPLVADAPERISAAGFDDRAWLPAVVPGTVLTSLVANGVYPDPDFGLNNLAIPESLSRQDYWYRAQFRAPRRWAGRHLTLTFNGVNYAAEVWLNGARLGTVRGAFLRGVFDVTTGVLSDADNVLAVRVSPPPHPGIPHEQSVAAGPGENGGSLAIDGPTFIATEGWDWIPAIRDRNTGLWQGVELTESGPLRLLDPQVLTRLPLPRTDSAELEIRVAVENLAGKSLRAVVEASVDDVRLRKELTIGVGVSELTFGPGEFPQLRIAKPRLWWPNGYGAPALHELELTVLVDGATSESRRVRFGMREITYELSLFDRSGRLRRVEIDPTQAGTRGERLVDVRHEAIKRTATGWAESLTAAGERSPAVRDAASVALTPYLVIRVNGVAIAARGGSWGMDDSRKRVARAHLEPFFRLHRDAHLNIIRNWLGQNTEEVFYDLADEYGLLVLNDFWASTQDFQVEPQDPQLFLANAADVIRRFRNHPSIALWFGRNEGVPQPILNEGLADLVATLDGTRYYTGSSNSINLQGSGPYNWRPPVQYFTELARGFSVEVGTPSLASLESLRSSIPEPDLWPLGDVYAYHDWHFGGNGDSASFMQALERGLGAAASIDDFERKAQLLNYQSYRAIFEGFQAHLWTRNSGRLLWMTHPSWPSNSWQIYTSDYDTPAAYYAVAKACEPVHAQLNLPDFSLAVVNTSREARRGLQLRSRVVSLDGRDLLERLERVEAASNDVTTLSPLKLGHFLEVEGAVLVVLNLSDAQGRLVSSNTYWQARDDAAQRALATMPAASLSVAVHSHAADGGQVVDIRLDNRGSTPALLTKLTLLGDDGQRVLPAYYSDNYFSLLPHEAAQITARCPTPGRACSKVAVRGWNVVAAVVPIAAGPSRSPILSEVSRP